ncbi:hypothetical protein RND81_01G215100 [Saponaria officinalis]|uniref:GDSL esterase/lipase n=1 Tax=Saponaria officinalis TaxID=3572 RepID=A0AAW1NHW0_SAPOF
MDNMLHIFSIYFLVFACIFDGIHVNAANVQGLFIFGSSVVDNGNNNFIPGTSAKANYAPYGVDFPSGPTGRFSNGKNIADLLAERLGLPLIPPFDDPNTKGPTIVHGVNFGSGGSGILNETGSLLGKVTSLNSQIGNFETITLPALEAQLKSQRTQILPNYLFMIAAGNNDYLLNYFLGRHFLTPQDFAAKLLFTYSNQLQLEDQASNGYSYGVSVDVRFTPTISEDQQRCSPVISHGVGCLPVQNVAVSIFHEQLINTVNGLKQQLPGVDIVVVNSVKIITDIISNPAASGKLETRWRAEVEEVRTELKELLAEYQASQSRREIEPLPVMRSPEATSDFDDDDYDNDSEDEYCSDDTYTSDRGRTQEFLNGVAKLYITLII